MKKKYSMSGIVILMKTQIIILIIGHPFHMSTIDTLNRFFADLILTFTIRKPYHYF